MADFDARSTAEEVTRGVDLTGRTILLTGCNTGIGHETLRVLTLRGAHVIAAARTLEKARAACAAVRGETTPVACELSDFDSVRTCADSVLAAGRPLDAIVCNAGIMALPRLQQRYGLELQFVTNHLGHFLLVTRLLEAVLAAPAGRVVMVSSGAHTMARSAGIEFDNLSGTRRYSPWRAYGQSKLANLLFARELDRRLQGTPATANALHPGAIGTDLARNLNPVFRFVFSRVARPFLKSIPQGAATQCWVATAPALEGVGGLYFADCTEAPTTPQGRDPALARRLWAVSEDLVTRH